MVKINGIKFFLTPSEASDINVLKVRDSERNICCIRIRKEQKKYKN